MKYFATPAIIPGLKDLDTVPMKRARQQEAGSICQSLPSRTRGSSSMTRRFFPYFRRRTTSQSWLRAGFAECPALSVATTHNNTLETPCTLETQLCVHPIHTSPMTAPLHIPIALYLTHCFECFSTGLQGVWSRRPNQRRNAPGESTLPARSGAPRRRFRCASCSVLPVGATSGAATMPSA